MLGGAIGGVVFQRLGPAALYIGASLLALAGGLLGWSALDAPAFTRPHPIAEPVAPPPGPEPVYWPRIPSGRRSPWASMRSSHIVTI